MDRYYKFKSPYHSTLQYLPFIVTANGYVKTIEYRGKTAYQNKGCYNNLVESVIINCAMVETTCPIEIEKLERKFINAKEKKGWI